MENKDQSAYPRPYSHDERPLGGHEGDYPQTFPDQTGLTKRELIAAMAMQGMLANPLVEKMVKEERKRIAECAIEHADELLSQLQSKP